MTARQPRLAARALIVQDSRLLLVNATPDRGENSWCTPGGGITHGETLHEGLAREVFEETGLRVEIGPLTALHEFHAPQDDFQQIDLLFQTRLLSPHIPENWTDSAGVVVKRTFFSLEALQGETVFPAILKNGFWLQNPPLPVYSIEHKT